MRVLVDCTQITSQKAGVGVYALNLVQELLKIQRRSSAAEPKSSLTNNSGGPDRIWLLAHDDDPDFALEGDFFRVLRVPGRIFRILPLRLILEQVYIPWLTRKHRIDVVHSLHYSFPLLKTRARRIVTVHDLTSFIMPQVHTRVKLVYFHLFLRAASRFADGVVFVSRSTQGDWQRYFPQNSPTQFVIPLGKAAEYRPDLPSPTISGVLERYKITKPYLLYIGTIEPRKNLARLVEAFARIQRSFPTYTLVIAGKKGWMFDDLFQTVAALQLEKSVLFTGFIREHDKPYLIAGAEAFVYPSLYEGFGIPVLEALACGTPTLTSDSSSLREVAGDAAVLVNPESVDDIAVNLRRLITEEELREALRSRAVVQASKFDWTRMAEETLAAYRTCCEATE